MHPPAGRRRGTELPQCWRAPDPVPSYIGPAPGGFGWDRDELKEALRGRRVVLIGDSITRQWFYSLECYLTRRRQKDRIWNSTRTAQEWGGMKYYQETKNNASDDLGYAAFYLEDVQAEVKVYLGGFMWPPPADSLMARHAKGAKEEADLVVVGQGSHFNNPNAAGDASLRANLLAYMGSCKAWGVRCVLREPTPAHFWYPEMKVQSGLWQPSRGTTCISSTYNESEEFYYDTSAEWRNQVVHDVLESMGQADRIMRIFDALLPLTYAHPGNDCTHWRFMTEYWEPWHAELFRLLQELPPRQGLFAEAVQGEDLMESARANGS